MTREKRLIAPRETLARARELFGPLGITRVANVTGLDTIGIPVVMVCRPNARSLSVSQGKGCDLDAARASGVMESIELYHAERIVRPLLLASQNELRFGHALAEVERLPRIAGSYFTPNSSLLWIEGADLLSGMGVWVPYELVHTNFTIPFPTGTGCFVMSSNGLASGNHLLEAVIHAICELIERDAVTLFCLRTAEQQDALQLDLSTVNDAACRALLETFDRAGMAVSVWDVTSDLGVPVFRAEVIEREPNLFREIGVVEGAGCHLQREVALSRALTEAAQGRLTMIAGSRDDNDRTSYERSRDGHRLEAARARAKRLAARSFEATRSIACETLQEDVDALLSRVKTAGLPQVIAVDLTKPEFGIPVVRVVIPGLETYHHVEGAAVGARARALMEHNMKIASST